MAISPSTIRGHRKHKIRSKKFSFTKVAVVFVGLCVVAANLASYHLSYIGLDSNSAVTEGINTGYGVILLGYMLKSLGEHWSMNKFGIEEE